MSEVSERVDSELSGANPVAQLLPRSQEGVVVNGRLRRLLDAISSPPARRATDPLPRSPACRSSRKTTQYLVTSAPPDFLRRYWSLLGVKVSSCVTVPPLPSGAEFPTVTALADRRYEEARKHAAEHHAHGREDSFAEGPLFVLSETQ